MGDTATASGSRGKWLALTAALLGWLFDGLEMGLFPLVGRPALLDLIPGATERDIGLWLGVATAVFLIGAATGGVLFGWLGDRLGRVRAMVLSVLVYAIFTGLCAFAWEPWHIAVLRFLSALGMGGEWSLGVALVIEIWPDSSRAFLAGMIGAAANVGFLLIAVLGLGLASVLTDVQSLLLNTGISDTWVDTIMRGKGWRLLMLMGAVPALLSFFIRIWVPESEKWKEEHGKGTTSHWAPRDLLGVLVGAMGAAGFVTLWAGDFDWWLRIVGSVVGLSVITAGYVYPVYRYLQRAAAAHDPVHGLRPTLSRMLLGAALSGIALLGTWGSIQNAPSWADKLTEGAQQAREWTQIMSGLGAILGTIGAAYLGDWLGRRLTYMLLCIGSLAATLILFRLNTGYGWPFLASAFLAGGLTASFYGWLPLYLPELFRTSVRATGQGFSFNFGRVLAAVGALQLGNLMALFNGGYPAACSFLSLIYLVGVVVIWFAPETHGKPLPS